MATPPNAIPVPKPAAGAFNKNRPAGALLQSQVLHLREAMILRLHELSTLLAVDVHSLKTEGHVSEYIKKATAILHPHGAKRPGK